jgi:hypothetical protein
VLRLILILDISAASSIGFDVATAAPPAIDFVRTRLTPGLPARRWAEVNKLRIQRDFAPAFCA